MDFKKKVIVLSSVAGFLVLTLIFGIIFSGENNQKRKYDKKLLSYFNNKKSSEIVITKDSKYLKLSKKNNLWTVDLGDKNILAKKDKVEELLKEIKNLKVGKKITKNSSKFQNFGVADDNTKKIVITDSTGAVTALNFGNTIENSRQYIRKQDGKTVYATKNIDNLLSTNKKDWYNLKLLKKLKKSTDIQSLTINGQNLDTQNFMSYTLIKSKVEGEKELQWKLVDSEDKLNQTSVEILTNTTANLEATDILITENQLINPILTLLLTKFDGTKMSFDVFANRNNPNQFYAKVSDDDTIYILSKYSLSNIFKEKDFYIEK